jgi:DnaJ-class molecular chaperone
MGIKRNDLAQGHQPCKECSGVGTTPGMSAGIGRAQLCKECKGIGWVLDKPYDR